MNIALSRLYGQRLTGERFASPVAAVGHLLAVQSQDFGAAKWALAQRTQSIGEAGLDALFDAGEILRAHVMRPTWHFVLPEDAIWLQQLTAQRVKARMAAYDRGLEVDPSLLARSHAVLEKTLRDRTYRTRSEVAAALQQAGISAVTQRLGQVLMHAELDRLIVSGPRRGGQQTYALLAERAPTARHLEGDEALAELTRRYVVGHGPAQAQDLAWWSGLSVTEVRRGLDIAGAAFERRSLDGKTYWSAPAEPERLASRAANLLPNYDEFLVGYHDRGAVLQRLDGHGSFNPLGNVVTLDGQVVGSWKLHRQSRQPRLELNVLAPGNTPALGPAIHAFGSYLGVELRVG